MSSIEKNLLTRNALIDSYNQYAQGLDTKDWPMVRDCFADEVLIDYGDLSAVMMNNMPIIANYLATPSIDIALLPEWETKMQKMIESTYKENVTNISGVPSWTFLLLQGILEKTGASTVLEVWPNLELYIHGGVSFEPYRDQFAEIIGGQIAYRETYNASEGFFGIQDHSDKDMLLMLDYGIFYEFIPLDELDKKLSLGLRVPNASILSVKQ